MLQPALNIIEAMDHPDVFGKHFRGDSWAFWRMFLSAMFVLPMDAEMLEFYRHHTGRTKAPTVAFKEAALVIGRRGGKSRILALIACYLGTFFDYTPFLAAGEVGTIAIIAADRKQARSIFRYVKGLLSESAHCADMIDDETSDTISLNNRISIEIHTASFRVTRGYTLLAALCDETAFWRDENSANPDTEIFRALRPGLATIPNSLLLNASSPYRRAGLLWKTHQRHYGNDDARVLVVKATTAEANPEIDTAIIAEAYDDDPESAACEYGAEFRTDIADFVSRSVVEACIEPGCHERPRLAGVYYTAFIDAAGGSGSDSMTIGISHHDKEAGPVLDALRERKPPFSPESVVHEFSALMKSYGIHMAESDKWGGDWVGEAFRKNDITVKPSAAAKSDIYRELLPLLNGHRCGLLDSPRLVTQLCGLERRTARGGKDSIDHAPTASAHDDLANVAAGALLRAQKKRAPMVFTAAFLDSI